jgi:predicted amidohydrolase
MIARVAALALVVAVTVSLQADPAPTEKIRIRVAGAQIPMVRDVAKNVETLTRAIAFAAREKADVLVTPEGSLSGYYAGFDAAATERGLELILQRTRAAKLALVLGTCFAAKDGRRYDAQQFYDREGRYLGFHAKILLCRRMADPEARAEIDAFQSRPLRTFDFLGLTVGGLVCNDVWAHPEWTPMDDPHLSQKLADMGARLIFVSANTGQATGEALRLDRAYHDTNLRLRARTGKLWVVVANAAPTPPRERGSPSGVLAPDGSWALSVPAQGEQFFVHTIEIEPRVISHR